MTGSPLLFIYSDAATIDSTAAAPLGESGAYPGGFVTYDTWARAFRHAAT